MLSKLPNLKTITTRKLHVGEHIPGWEGPEALKHLSYYRPDLPIKEDVLAAMEMSGTSAMLA